MHQTEHARAMADCFRELVEQSGDSLPENHYEELKLIIEAGLDTALAESMEAVAGKLQALANEIQHDAAFFD
jgi:hypothetical protein